MKARLVVFPIRGRNWCFSRSIDRHTSQQSSNNVPSTLTDLWKKLSSGDGKSELSNNTELVIDFVSNKMNGAWTGLENAPPGSVKSKIHGIGVRLLSRVKPSEIFLKSITKEVSNVQITYPTSLNDRLVRRRLRHIALRGAVIHRKYLYGSVTLLPMTSVFMVLPLPNILFFWVLFRAYSHWRALQGSERLVLLVSDDKSIDDGTGNVKEQANHPLWVLQASDELEKLIKSGDAASGDGLSKCIISNICKTYDLNTIDVLKYMNSM
ncbi:uncharacterized protein LOC124944654 [Impatiens glandulifera]|uniref:uncharacterized protein LOC124944654 n=1 Tax=Impatiens glandulifera TaxID=253017 RepID=UPI001FB11D19|nr:uncharacterized protein LOC124944654 [Impatiens glandulifera]